LRGLGVTEPQDIDVEAIAEHCGCAVRYRRLDGCAARIVGVADRAIISVDEDSPEGRRRFSVGHELGHWRSDYGKATFECQKNDLRKPWSNVLNPEARANEFAAELLMPAFLLEPMVDGQPVTFRTVDAVVAAFSVSRTAAAIRLVQLSASPCMLVCHDTNGRRWFAASRKVEGHLWPLSQLSPETDAHDILHGLRAGSGRSQTVDADDWINHPAASRYTIQEHSVQAGDVVLSLLWWKDPSMVEDLIP
jgi:Zn-dependent peptidase ImmA (M78 family)